MKPKVLVLTGYGINCDYETQHAFESSGAEAHRVHVNSLIEKPTLLEEYQILAIPGGFAYGDDLGSGKILAVKLASHLSESLSQFLENKKLIMGICNGFQVLVKLGILPGTETKFQQTSTLTFNESGKFEDRWVHLNVNSKSSCVFTKNIESMYLPVRHGEGRFVTKDKKTLERLIKNNQVVLQYVNNKGKDAGYPWNPNGSQNNIAGICDVTGRVFGLMPHPEAFLESTNHPSWTRKTETIVTARKIFFNAVEYAKTNL